MIDKREFVSKLNEVLSRMGVCGATEDYEIDGTDYTLDYYYEDIYVVLEFTDGLIRDRKSQREIEDMLDCRFIHVDTNSDMTDLQLIGDFISELIREPDFLFD